MQVTAGGKSMVMCTDRVPAPFPTFAVAGTTAKCALKLNFQLAVAYFIKLNSTWQIFDRRFIFHAACKIIIKIPYDC